MHKRTPLIWALTPDRIDMFEVLLKAGASTEICDKNGKTVLDYAIKMQNPKAVKLIQQYQPKMRKMVNQYLNHEKQNG